MMARRTFLAAGASLGASACLGIGDHSDRVGPVRRRPASARDAVAAEEGELRLYQVGHSTQLLGLAGRTVLTDPWFFDPALGFFRHALPLGFEPEELGPIDLVLVSHDHADHYDRRALDVLDKGALVLVATREQQAEVRALGYREVEVGRPGETIDARGLAITTTEAVHDGYEVNYVVAGGGRSFFFGGDTAWHGGIPAIAERFRLDLALLPVDGTRFGPYGDRVVMTPEEAVRAARVLGAAHVVPTHAGDEISSGLGRWLFPRVPEAAARFMALARTLEGQPARMVAPGRTLRVPSR